MVLNQISLGLELTMNSALNFIRMCGRIIIRTYNNLYWIWTVNRFNLQKYSFKNELFSTYKLKGHVLCYFLKVKEGQNRKYVQDSQV